MTPQEFAARYGPLAQKYAPVAKLPPELLLAISGHETGWGTSSHANQHNNFFGWFAAGDRGARPDGFGIFSSPEASFAAAARGLGNPNGYYADATNYYAQTGDLQGTIQRIQQRWAPRGVANDPTDLNKNWTPRVSEYVSLMQQSLGGGRAGGSTPPSPPAAPSSVGGLPGSMSRDQQRGWVLPAEGGITSLFGNNYHMDGPATYQGRYYPNFNKGIDIGAGPGSAVMSMTGGTVVSAGDVKGWGNRVVVRDQDGYLHGYGHLDPRFNVKPGDTVAPGQLLGVVGGHGASKLETSSGAHLSYDVFDANGEPVNPTPWLTQGGQGQSAVSPAIQHDPSRNPKPTGGGGMASPVAPTARGAVAAQHPDVAAARKRYEDLLNRQTFLLNKSGKSVDEVIELQNIGNAVDNAFQIFASLAKLYTPDPVATATNTATIETNRGQLALNVANSENEWNLGVGKISTDVLQSIANMAFAAFDKDIARANQLIKVFEINQNNLMGAVKLAYEKGKLDLDSAAAIVQAKSLQQAAEAARALEVGRRADKINEASYRNAMSMLPPGTKYIPGLEPDGMLAQAAAKHGMTLKPVEATQVPYSMIDPVNSLRQAEGTVAGVPDFGVANVQQAAQRTQGLPTFQPQPLDPTSLGLPNTPDMTAVTSQMQAIPAALAAGYRLPDLSFLNAPITPPQTVYVQQQGNTGEGGGAAGGAPPPIGGVVKPPAEPNPGPVAAGMNEAATQGSAAWNADQAGIRNATPKPPSEPPPQLAGLGGVGGWLWRNGMWMASQAAASPLANAGR